MKTVTNAGNTSPKTAMRYTHIGKSESCCNTFYKPTIHLGQEQVSVASSSRVNS